MLDDWDIRGSIWYYLFIKKCDHPCDRVVCHGKVLDAYLQFPINLYHFLHKIMSDVVSQDFKS